MLIIKKSRIKGAGKGLFTTSKIAKNDLIVEYKGEKLTWAECEARNEKAPDQMAYFFYISPKRAIDASTTPQELARYANDAEGTIKTKRHKNNAEYQVIKGVPYIVATKNISANSEIFVSYGEDYWEIHNVGS